MIDAEHSSERRYDGRAGHLRCKETRSHAGEYHKCSKSVEIRYACANCISGNLRAAPLDREGDGSAAHHSEIEGVVGVSPEVLGVHSKISPECLLQAGVEFVSPARMDRPQVTIDSRRRDQSCDKRDAASGARNDHILVKWALQGSGVGNTENRIGFLEVVRDPQARLGLLGGGETVVEIGAN